MLQADNDYLPAWDHLIISVSTNIMPIQDFQFKLVMRIITQYLANNQWVPYPTTCIKTNMLASVQTKVVKLEILCKIELG